MKKFIVLTLFSLICFAGFGQSKVSATKKVAKVAVSKKDTTSALGQPMPTGTVIFFLSPEQVQLLEYVIANSDASFKETQKLIQLLKTQQYPPKDTTTSIPPKIPKVDSTEAKH